MLDQMTFNQIAKELKEIENKYNVKLVGEIDVQSEYDYYYEEVIEVIYPYIAILDKSDKVIGKIREGDDNVYICD